MICLPPCAAGPCPPGFMCRNGVCAPPGPMPGMLVPIGTACGVDNDCTPPAGGFCVPEFADGGLTGYSRGYCSAACAGAPCSSGICVTDSSGSFCKAECPGPGGRSTCRPDYLCHALTPSTGWCGPM
jgi:hypothetical protein